MFRIYLPKCFAHLRKQPVNAVFSTLLAALEMKYSFTKRSVAAAVACVVGLFSPSCVNVRWAVYGLAEPTSVTMMLL